MFGRLRAFRIIISLLLGFSFAFPQTGWKNATLELASHSPDSAISILNHKLQNPLESNDKAYTYALMLRVARKQGLLEAAQKYELALKLFKETGDAYSMMGLQINFGKLNVGLQHYQEAIQNLTRARGLAESLSDIRTSANIRSSLGSVYLEMGQLDSARTFFSQSLQICDNLNLFPGQLMNHTSLSNTENDAQKARLLIGNKPIPHELIKTHNNFI